MIQVAFDSLIRGAALLGHRTVRDREESTLAAEKQTVRQHQKHYRLLTTLEYLRMSTPDRVPIPRLRRNWLALISYVKYLRAMSRKCEIFERNMVLAQTPLTPLTDSLS